MTDELEQMSEFADDPRTGNGGQVETLEDRKQRSREMIPVVSGRGLSPENYAAFVTVAQGMCKPDNLILRPELRSNVAVVIGLLDIAARARLSPYLLAMKCYVQKGTLCFESQAFHALARPFLDGGLKGEYVGEGQDRVLIVRGRLKGDPYEYEHRSPPLGQVHPGHVMKEVNGERVQFCKGSPLWDRKPDVQLWYDTTRDWVRLHCPEATLGIYTTDEVDADDFRDLTPRPTLGERLAVSPRPMVREGFRPAEVATSLVHAADDESVEQEMAAAPIPVSDGIDNPVDWAGQPPKRKRGRPRKVVSAPEPKTRGRKAVARKTRQQPALARQEASGEESDAAAYVAQATAWITQVTDPDAAAARWDSEYDERNRAEVPIGERNRLRAMLEERLEHMRK